MPRIRIDSKREPKKKLEKIKLIAAPRSFIPNQVTDTFEGENCRANAKPLSTCPTFTYSNEVWKRDLSHAPVIKKARLQKN